MSLEQAVGVVIGANIGTTITGQMIAFKLTKAALPAIAFGVGLKYFSKKRNYRHIGDIILGFGLLFYGMTVMKNGLAPIKSDPQFIEFFTTFSTESLGGILLCVFMGTVLTVAVQSSSATVGLTMTLAVSGLLTYPTALALVLGENIGTTVTAQLSTIGSKNIEAHRTANAHTIFNVINAVVFIIFLPKLVQLTILLSPKPSKSQERYKLPEFDSQFIDSPIGALAKVKGEIIKTIEFTHMNLRKTSTCLTIRDDDILGERDAVEEHLDDSQKVIIKYLTTIYQGEVNEPEAKEISELMRITNNIERIGDSMENVSKILERIYDNKFEFSNTAKNDLVSISEQVDKFLGLIIEEFQGKTEGFYQKALALEDLIDQMRENMRFHHIERLRNGECSVDVGVLFIALVSNYEKMGDYCYNIATGHFCCPETSSHCD